MYVINLRGVVGPLFKPKLKRLWPMGQNDMGQNDTKKKVLI